MRALIAAALCWLGHVAQTSASSSASSESSNSGHTTIPHTVPQQSAARPVAPDFISFSIEFSAFPAYAGTPAQPNTLTRALLAAIATAQGSATPPVIRVGGASQDRALLTGYMDTPFNFSYIPRSADDYLPYGRAFYESYLALPGTRFIHGLNLARSGGPYARHLRSAVVMACEEFRRAAAAAPVTPALLAVPQKPVAMSWEIGHEPDLYGRLTALDPDGRRAVVRSAAWDEAAYVRDWLTVQRELRSGLAQSCPEMTDDASWSLVGPSFSGREGGMSAIRAWESGLQQEKAVKEFSSHFYAVDGLSTELSIAQRAISDHAQLKLMLAPQIELAKQVSRSGTPFILGETNFARTRGIPGLSDTFAAALWTLDLALHAAANGIARIQLHQDMDDASAAWQPLTTPPTPAQVRPAYYGALAAASMTARGARVLALDTAAAAAADRPVVAYAAYEGTLLRRVMLLNLAGGKQQRVVHSFGAPANCAAEAVVSRLAAPSAAAREGVSWAGMQFGADGFLRIVDEAGRERVHKERNGAFKVVMDGVGAAMLDLTCE